MCRCLLVNNHCGCTNRLPQSRQAYFRGAAKSNYLQLLAAFNLANTRLLEGKFHAEARLFALEKAELELNLARRQWEENNRRHQKQETLFEAGGIHKEAILVSRFSLDTEWKQIELMKKELEIRKIGCRDQDLLRAGLDVPLCETERLDAFISLLTLNLKAELDAAHARLEAAEKELTSANIALAELTITSPISGTVGARYLEEGERIRSQDLIMTVIDSSSLYAIFPVRERDALRIEKGMYSSVMIDGTGDILNGTVDLIYPQADNQSLSFLIRVLLEKTETINRLRPGMFVRAAVTLGSPRQAFFIPESAIFNQKNNEGSVFVINGSTLTERKIFLGPSRGEEREINGLNAGELIVIRPDTDLREGIYVSLAQ